MLFVWILLNLIVVTSTTGSWHQLDGIEYYIEYTTVVGVDKAKEGCKAMNAILAVVKSQRIQDFLVKNINTTKLTGKPYSFYIGLRRTSPNTLEWSDGTTTNTSVFTYWDNNDKVYHSSKPCVTMGWEGGLNVLFKWKIVQCWKIHRYICQRAAPTTVPPTTTEITTIAETTTIQETTTTTIKTTTTTNFIIYVVIGIGAIVVILIIGIIYIKFFRKKQDSNEAEMRENVLYGITNHASTLDTNQSVYETADTVSPVYSYAGEGSSSGVQRSENTLVTYSANQDIKFVNTNNVYNEVNQTQSNVYSVVQK
ncbi:uncharacterized protein LOC113475657 [Ciona intestinalis]